jgi:hypothetical protein
MATCSAAKTARVWQQREAAGWLALAASPSFALMAGVAASDAHPIALCSRGLGILQIDGMTAMYVLMSVFHLRPWLGQFSSWSAKGMPRFGVRSDGDGDSGI